MKLATPGVLNEDLPASGGSCVGIECNIWEWERCRRNGKRGLGYAALHWEQFLEGHNGHSGDLEEYQWAALLPSKTAGFLPVLIKYVM